MCRFHFVSTLIVLRQEPVSQAAALLLRHFGLRSVRGYGAFLSHDGFLAPLRFLSDLHRSQLWGCRLDERRWWRRISDRRSKGLHDAD